MSEVRVGLDVCVEVDLLLGRRKMLLVSSAAGAFSELLFISSNIEDMLVSRCSISSVNGWRHGWGGNYL